jgi:hypothetical protein
MSPLSVLTDLLGSADFLRVQLRRLADPREADELFETVAKDVDAEPAARAILKRLEDAGIHIR